MTPSLTRALTLIAKRKPAERAEWARKVSTDILTDETANDLYGELLALRGGVLFKDEADLLDGIATRLDRPVTWRSGRLDGEPFKEGRYATTH